MAKVHNLDISDLYEEAVDAWGPQSLPPLEGIRVTLQPNMTKAGGRAFPKRFKRRNGQLVERDWYGMTISLPWMQALQSLVPDEVENEFRDTVLHELAHIACYHAYPNDRAHHGYRWEQFCIQVGCRPERYIWMTKDPTKSYVGSSSITWAMVLKHKNGGDLYDA